MPWVGRLRGERGYLSVLVNINHVRGAVRSAEHGGITLRQVSQTLRTNDRAIAALIANRHLVTFSAKNPVNRCMQTLVAPAEFERFQKAYVSLHVLANERKRHHLALKMDLDVAGIRPVFDHKEIGARFYRRDAVEEGVGR